mmetsp:Transcript_5370/g.7914  ORF Transcript_5370/g.7914 Transcript_5370/m.7914 type:complete len:102 (-) Transcript_5370:3227-3532(-)
MVPEDEVYIHTGKYKHNRANVVKLLPIMVEVQLLTGWKAGKTVRINQGNAVVVEMQYRTRGRQGSSEVGANKVAQSLRGGAQESPNETTEGGRKLVKNQKR